MSTVTYSKNAVVVAQALLQAGSFLIALDRPAGKWFRWRCGISAPAYCNCRSLLGAPIARSTVNRAFIEAFRVFFPDIQLVAAMSTPCPQPRRGGRG